MRVIFLTCQEPIRERALSSHQCNPKSPWTWNLSERLARPIRSFLLPSIKISHSLLIYFQIWDGARFVSHMPSNSTVVAILREQLIPALRDLGRGSRMFKVSDRGWPCQEFEPRTTKDLPCRAAMHVQSVESSNVLLLVWCDRRGVPSSGVVHVT
ncbi:hypothetical protein TNCV_1923801 [Trichonephila clavipes]|nr:hypothetical protein TNCV_1923801 [Trichonephila clavipes]